MALNLVQIFKKVFIDFGLRLTELKIKKKILAITDKPGGEAMLTPEVTI